MCNNICDFSTTRKSSLSTYKINSFQNGISQKVKKSFEFKIAFIILHKKNADSKQRLIIETKGVWVGQCWKMKF